jgi:hypothetical protein
VQAFAFNDFNLPSCISEVGEQISPDVKNFYTNIDELIHQYKGLSEEELILLLTLKSLVGRYFNNQGDKEGSPGYLVHKAMRLIKQEDLIPFLGTVRFGEKNKDMILAYIAIMNDILLEIVMNSTIFSGERIHLNQMVARGGKNIFNMFMFLVKNSLLQFHTLKAGYGTNSISVSSITDAYTHKVIIMQSYINDCINYIALNPGSSGIVAPPINNNQSTKSAQFNSEGGRFHPDLSLPFGVNKFVDPVMGQTENFNNFHWEDAGSTNSALMSQMDTSRVLAQIQAINYGQSNNSSAGTPAPQFGAGMGIPTGESVGKNFTQFGQSANNQMSNMGLLQGSFISNPGNSIQGGGPMFSLDFGKSPVGPMPGTFFGSNVSGISIDKTMFNNNNNSGTNANKETNDPNYNQMIAKLLNKDNN